MLDLIPRPDAGQGIADRGRSLHGVTRPSLERLAQRFVLSDFHELLDDEGQEV